MNISRFFCQDLFWLRSRGVVEQTPVGVQFVDVGFDFIVVGTNKI